MQRYPARLLFLVMVLTGLTRLSVGADEPKESPVRATLRVEWNHPAEGQWNGTVRVSEGRVDSARPLQWRGNHVTTLAAADENEMHFRSDGPAPWSGIEVVLDAPPSAQVDLTIGGEQLQAAFADLLRGSTFRLNSSIQVRLRRAAGDILPVRVSRTPLIYKPGESIEFEVELRLLARDRRPLKTKFHVALRSAREGTWLFSRRADLTVETNTESPSKQKVTVRMPSGEGVYDLVLRAEPEEEPISERVIQFVVISDEPATEAPTELETRLVQEIDPSQPTPDAPWYSARRLRARTSRLGQYLWSSVRHPFGAAAHTKESPVVGYRLSIENPGRPHLVNIEYEDCGNVLLAAAVTEQDPSGAWTQWPLASGLRSDEKPTSTSIQSHQLVCWPQTKQPFVSVSVDAATGPAAVKRIRVQELPRGLPVLDVPEPDGTRRFFGLSLDHPDLWASWSSGRAIDTSTQLPIDDWRTYFDSMTHVAEYARFAGYNSILATVVAQGSSLYPSHSLGTNYQLDNGALAEAAPDPVQKDVVELFLKICQRHRLSFFAGLRLEGAIPALDRKLNAGDAAPSGLLLLSREGKGWDEMQSSAASPVRRYNPLNPDVQAALLEVVREVVANYGRHPALSGLAIDLAPSSHLVLPNLEWGYDDHTIGLFQKDTGVELPEIAADDPARFARRHQVLTTAVREPWMAWRCRQLTKFYDAVLAEIQRAAPGAHLVLSVTALSGVEESREAIRAARSVDEALRAKGIDLRLWSSMPRSIVLRPLLATGAPGEGLQLSSGQELDDLMGHLPQRGTLCIHEPEILNCLRARDSSEQGDASVTEPVAIAVPRPGRANLRRYAQSLAGGDCVAIFEGGPVVAMGQEQVQREFARVFRSLPASTFQPLETLQPVIVRSRREPRDARVYLVNDASYTVETNLWFHCAADAVLRDGATGDRLSTHPTESGLGTRLTLEPFQTMYLQLDGPDSTIAQCDVTVPQAAERGLRVRFDRLRQAMAVMGSDASRTLDGLPPNGDFEEAADDVTPLHWTPEGDGTVLSLDSQMLHGGTFALRLEERAGSSAVSDWFRPPDARSLAMNVWLRANRPGVRLRWFLVGKNHHEIIYRCYADLPLSTNWEAKQFRARDLPHGQIKQVQVKFQLLDEGALWIDEARLCALPISQDEKMAISKSVSAIFEAWKERRWSDFERLSEGYWPTYLIESVEGAKEASH